MTNFSEKFSTYSNTDLFRIIQNPDDYQPLAVQTAENIIATRQLSEQEIENVKAELYLQKQEKELEDQKKKGFENKLKDIGTSITEAANPIQTEAPNTEKLIKIISFVFSGLFFYYLIIQFDLIRFMFSSSDADWDFSMVVLFLPMIIILISTPLFYKRIKLGWTLLTIYITYSATSTLMLLYLDLNRKPSNNTILESLVPQNPITVYLGSLLFFCGFLTIMCKENIRAVYKVDRQAMFITTGVVAFITGITLYGLFK